MNFSNTKMLRKILSLVIAAIMVTTLFAGCSKKDNKEPSSDPTINLDPPASTDPQTEPVPTETEEINENMATILSQLNVRSAPTDQGTPLGTLYPGDKVEITQTEKSLGVEWGFISTPIEGWVCMDFVEWDYRPADSEDPDGETPDATTPDDDDELDPIDKIDKDTPGASTGNGNTSVLYKGTVTASELNIRKSNSTSSESVGSLKRGARVEILEKNGNWGRIKQGWISLQHVDLESGNSGSSDNNNKPDNGNGSTNVIAKGIVNTKELNIRESATQDSDRLGSYKFGARVEIYEKSNGWGRTNKGWIALNYVYMDGSGTGNNKYGVVTANELNIRSGPGRSYASVGSLNEGADVTILFRVDADGMTWGNIKQGWISMDYVDLDDEDEDDEDDRNDSSDDNDDDDVESIGYVTADGLNIREEPDSDSDKVGYLEYGDRVEILEIDGNWGRIKKGWICLDYVDMD